MQNRRPAQFNVVSSDPSGNTWALPKDAIVRFGKGLMNAWDVKLSPDGTYFAIGTGMGFAFSPCGNLIVGGMNNEIRFWCAEKLTTLRTIPQLENNKRTFAFAFSPCGNYLASGTWWREGMEKMAIRIWDVATDENIHTFWGHTSDVQSLAFSPDGTHLASSGFDGTILVWDLKPFIDS